PRQCRGHHSEQERGRGEERGEVTAAPHEPDGSPGPGDRERNEGEGPWAGDETREDFGPHPGGGRGRDDPERDRGLPHLINKGQAALPHGPRRPPPEVQGAV